MWRINSNNQLTEIGSDKIANIVWVPSDKGVFYRAELPLNQKQIWAKTVGFLLEDQSIDDIEDLHFAIGIPDGHEKGVLVATLPLTLIEQWMQILKRKKIRAQTIWFDFLAIPFDGSCDAVVWHEDGKCILRLGQQECVVGSAEWVFSLSKITASLGRIRIYSDDITSLPQEWQERAEGLPGRLEERMVRLGQQKFTLNLMQGSICLESRLMTWLKPWYATAAALVFLLGIFLVEVSFEAKALKAHTSVLKKVTEKSFLEYFPDEKRVFNIRKQTAQRLSTMSSGGGRKRGQLWQLMKRLDRVLSACKPCRMEKMELQSTSVILDISTRNSFGQLIKSIEAIPKIRVSSNKHADREGRKQMSVRISIGSDTT